MLQTSTPPTKRRKWTLGRVATGLLILVVLGLVGSELVLRFWYGLGTPVLIQPDAAAGFVLQPNQHRFRFRMRTDVNAESMRSDPFAMPKPADVYRVLLLGDSMTYGTSHVPQESIYATLLANELPAQLGRKVEILNASAGAWAISNELGYLRSRGTFDADLVVLAINSGDIAQPPATFNDVGGDTGLRAYPTAWAELWDRYLRGKFRSMAPKRDAGTTTSNGSAAVDIANAKANLEHLTEFQKIVEADHARMSILFLAMPEYVPHNAVHGVQKPIADWAAEHHVPLVDATEDESKYAPADVAMDGIHLNVKGNRVVATYAEKHWNELDPALAAAAH